MKLIPFRWRWAHRLYANLLGYFWLPCPLCGRMFGGHEWRDRRGKSSTIWEGASGTGICPWCTLAGRGNQPKPPATHDMTRADYSFTPYDGGQRGSLACWDGKPPSNGDFLILRNGGNFTRYRVTKVNHCMNVDPPTMWMAKVAFAPRGSGSGTSKAGPLPEGSPASSSVAPGAGLS